MEKKESISNAAHSSVPLLYDSEHDRLELARNLCAENPHVAHVAK